MSAKASPSERPWSFPVALADIPETGRQVDLTADQGIRTALAQAIGVAALPRLEASFDVTRHGAEGLRVIGRVSATVTQNCVVTLEPMDSEIDEAVDLVFMPGSKAEHAASTTHDADAEEPPESLSDGTADLGAVATEFLVLGIDPYPRKPGVVFEPPAASDPANRPFAVLAALKTRGPGKDR